jgi:hypothetical protein
VESHDYDVIARQVSGLNKTVASLVQRLAEVERVNAQLEAAALATSRAMQEISRHWDAVYEAMRREEQAAGARREGAAGLIEDLREHNGARAED